MPILFRSGASALSPFRLESLQKRLSDGLSGHPAVRVEAAFAYVIDAERPLDADELKRADELLGAVGAEEEVNVQRPESKGGKCDSPDTFFVAPRRGTISPWSSKATDILRNCGLGAVRRVERAVRYRVSVATGGGDGSQFAVRSSQFATGGGDGSQFAADDAHGKLQTANGELQTSTRSGSDAVRAALHDRMTQGVYESLDDLAGLFQQAEPARGRTFDVLGEGRAALERANVEMGLAISAPEIDYLVKSYTEAGRNPTDTELVMFGQVNSEHCRHKIFGAAWIIDGEKRDESLFGMVRTTHAREPLGTLVAYKDNSGVLEGFEADAFRSNPVTHRYGFERDHIDILCKVETHNHPTAISPDPGAATGVGGEIRDEAATGTGSRTKAGIAGFMVSNLRMPGLVQPWERERDSFPRRLATPLEIMLEGPIGGAAFGNEFGRPQLCGFFRTYEQDFDGTERGYHKPIMLAGGMGNIRRSLVEKRPIPPGALVVQLGGPAMRIGLGGGAASSLASGSNAEDLDFDSVQRANPEMQRRCQEVIDACVALGDQNPILSIHDIGAGGLSNGCPELVEATGGIFQLRDVHNLDPSMSPMEIWCNESQERYVLAIRPEHRLLLEEVCRRERCPVAFIGTARADGRLVLEDAHFGDRPIDMDIRVLLGKPPRMVRDVRHVSHPATPPDFTGVTVEAAMERVLQLPAVADKTFLITIADRSVTGLVHRDQMCGPFQLPVADAAVTATGYRARTGEAMACGERPPVALVDAPASGRLAVVEALLNLASAAPGDRHRIKLSANWMCACGEPGEDAALFDTVRAVTQDLCPALGLAIPVGKDSLSMRSSWEGPDGAPRRQVAPVSLVVSAFAPVADVTRAVTPDLKAGPSRLLFADLSGGHRRLGASALAQVFEQVGSEPADVSDPALVAAFFDTLQELLAGRKILAYHDRSDGGLAVTLAEMAMAGGRGLSADLGDGDPLAVLFNEEPGAVLQVKEKHLPDVLAAFEKAGLSGILRDIGPVSERREVAFRVGGRTVLSWTISRLRRLWSSTTHRMQALRDNPACADQEYDNALDESNPGLDFRVAYDPETDITAPYVNTGKRPRMAILREEGVNGHVEMAAAFNLAGFETVDVHTTDLVEGRADLATFKGLVACGGFSYGDVLGAGAGWAGTILRDPRLRDAFSAFFARRDTFTLGVCNGCQMVSQLKGIIPGASHWPAFRRNVSEQFEARYCTLEVMDSPSVLLKGMRGSRIPIAVAHGEGLAVFDSPAEREALLAARGAALRYVDNRGAPTERYPYNPNGSEGGLTGFTSEDGRATILMPHPERGFRSVQLSYRPQGQFLGECGPWMRMFRNARVFVG